MSQNDQRSRNFKTPSSNLASRTTKGTAAELYFASIMLSNGYDVYQPLVDVKIDYLLKHWTGCELRFQCKSRNVTAADEYGFELLVPADQSIKRPTHLYLMVGSLPDPEFWIVPYEIFKKHSKKVTIGEKAGLRLIITPAIEAILDKYKFRDGLDQLNDWCLKQRSEEAS